MTEIWALLRPLERIESLMAEIYQALAETHEDDADAARLFGRLAMEERSHASQVQYVHRMARQSHSRVIALKKQEVAVSHPNSNGL